MLILLEGVDGSGKTTLFKQLQDKGINTEKSIGRKEPFQYYKWLAISSKRGPFVVDRSFLTELVYRTVDDMPAMKMSPSAGLWPWPSTGKDRLRASQGWSGSHLVPIPIFLPMDCS